MPTEWLAECNPLTGTIEHGFQGTLGEADQAHAVMDAAGTEPSLGDGETRSRCADQVFTRDAHAIEAQLGMAVGGIVITEHLQRPDDLQTVGIGRHQHHRMSGMGRGVGFDDTHDDQHSAIGVAGTGGPPFAPVEHQVVAVGPNAQGDRGGIRGGHVRLGHGEAGADLAGQQGRKPALFLGRASEQVQHFHVAGVRGIAVEHFRCARRAADQFGHRGVLADRQAGTVFGIGQEQVPQTLCPRFSLEGFDQRADLPAPCRIGVPFGQLPLGREGALMQEGVQAGVEPLGSGREMSRRLAVGHCRHSSAGAGQR